MLSAKKNFGQKLRQDNQFIMYYVCVIYLHYRQINEPIS